MAYQNLWDKAKTVLKWKFTVIQTDVKKREKSQSLILHIPVNPLVQETQQREVIKIKAEINEVEAKKITEKYNET